jgi:putative transposase
VIGWAIDDYLGTDLVTSAVAMRGELAGEVILHADRGCQGRHLSSARAVRPRP